MDCLEQAFILQRVYPEGTNVLREPKILMTPPCRLLYRDPEDAIGGLREDFFVDMLRQAGIEISYLKSTRGKKTPDYLVAGGPDKLVVEIGGPGKGRQQFKGIEIDRKLVFAHTDIPTTGSPVGSVFTVRGAKGGSGFRGQVGRNDARGATSDTRWLSLSARLIGVGRACSKVWIRCWKSAAESSPG